MARSDQKQKAALGVHRHNPVVADTDRRERIWAIAQAGSLASEARLFGNSLVEAVKYS